MVLTSPAPIVLFLFNRPEHARRTLEALRDNAGASDTDLIVYCDGPRNERDQEVVRAVRDLAHNVSGFRTVEVICREENLGLSQSTIQGVTQVVERYGRAIVVEDDILTARSFLTYMNAALQRYASERRVWHVSGWNYPIRPEGLPPYFFWRVMNCWGWATWADRWSHYRKEPERLVREWTQERIRSFNVDDAHDFFSQVQMVATKRIDTWAIFWYATIFEHGGLCLNPTRSYVQNIGLDGSGIHRDVRAEYIIDLARHYDVLPQLDIAPNPEAIARTREFMLSRRSLKARTIRRGTQFLRRLKLPGR